MTELEVSAQKHLKAEISKPSEDLLGELTVPSRAFPLLIFFCLSFRHIPPQSLSLLHPHPISHPHPSSFFSHPPLPCLSSSTVLLDLISDPPDLTQYDPYGGNSMYGAAEPSTSTKRAGGFPGGVPPPPVFSSQRSPSAPRRQNSFSSSGKVTVAPPAIGNGNTDFNRSGKIVLSKPKEKDFQRSPPESPVQTLSIRPTFSRMSSASTFRQGTVRA
jgi:hypothetical protein